MHSSGNMLNLKDIESRRKSPVIYKAFCENLIPCVLGKIRKLWKIG